MDDIGYSSRPKAELLLLWLLHVLLVVLKGGGF
jgi:hypothetical protein